MNCVRITQRTTEKACNLLFINISPVKFDLWLLALNMKVFRGAKLAAWESVRRGEIDAPETEAPQKKNVEKSFSSSASFFSGAALNWESRVEEISAEIFIDRERANGNRGKRGNSKTTARSIFSFCCHVVPFTSIASLFLQFMLPEKKNRSIQRNHTIIPGLR